MTSLESGDVTENDLLGSQMHVSTADGVLEWTKTVHHFYDEEDSHKRMMCIA